MDSNTLCWVFIYDSFAVNIANLVSSYRFKRRYRKLSQIEQDLDIELKAIEITNLKGELTPEEQQQANLLLQHQENQTEVAKKDDETCSYRSKSALDLFFLSRKGDLAASQ